MSDAAVEGPATAAPDGPDRQGVTGQHEAGQHEAGQHDAGQQRTGRPDTAPPAGPRWLSRGEELLRRHWLFAAALAGGAVLRAVVMLGYPPAMWFNDSYSYVWEAVRLSTATNHPSGYPFFLLLLLPLHSFTVVAVAQHLMGLAMGVLIYALLRRRWLPAWAATLAAVPVLYDAYQVQIEQQIMSDALFIVLVTAGVVVLCWSGRLSWQAAAAGGLLLGCAQLVRSAGLLLLVVVAVVLVIRRAGWRPVAALLVAGVIPVAGYMALFHLQHGQYGLTRSDGTFLYGRVSSFADCSVMKPPPPLARLCDHRPPGRRPIAVEYIWSRSDPLWKLGPGLFSTQTNKLAEQFAVRAIEAQPLSYAGSVLSDTWRAFGWSHNVSYDSKTDRLYLFSVPPPQIPAWGYWKVLHDYQPGLGQPHAVQPFASLLGRYQRIVYLPGAILGLILLAGLAGVVARWRRAGGPGLLPWAVAMTLLLLPIATSGFSYRYLLAVVPAACLAAGLAFGRDPVAAGQVSAGSGEPVTAGSQPAGAS